MQTNLEQIPKNVENEKAVLCCFMRNCSLLEKYPVKTNDFTLVKNEILYSTIERLYKEKGSTDLVLLTDYINKSKRKVPISYVSEIYNYPCTETNIARYVEILRNKSLLRKIIDTGSKIQEMGFDESTELVKMVKDVQGLVDNLSSENKKTEDDLINYDGEDKVVFANTLYESLDEEEKEGMKSIRKCGFKTLDDKTGGFMLGQLNLISGVPGMGKSSFVRTLIYNFYKQYQTKSLYLMFEETPSNVLRKLKAKVDKFQDPNYFNFYIPQKHTYDSVEWIESKILEAKLKYGVEVVIIDHLDDIYSQGKNQTEEQAIRFAVKALKKFAVKNEVIVFLIAHIQKQEKEERPKMKDLKGSAALQGEPDNIMFVHRVADMDENGNLLTRDDGEPKTDMKLARIYLDKNREGGVKESILMAFNFDKGLYYETQLNQIDF